MRSRLWIAIVVAVVLAVMVPMPALARPGESVSSGELVERPKDFDGDTVIFTGEAIGEAMVRGDMAWLHLNDDAYMEHNVEDGADLDGYNSGHAVWIDADLAAQVTSFGDYDDQGDIVTVTGVFNAACLEHGGDMDIHAVSLEILEAGHPVDDPVSGGKVAWAIGLAALAVGVFFVERATGRR
ncbi:MAG: DNA-binding protein [Coriobacteriia bacterium]